MQQPAPPKLPNEAELVGLSHCELISIARSQAQTIETLTAQLASVVHRLEWFERNLFGTKSERLRVLENDQQLALGEVLAPPDTSTPAKERTVAAHTRRVHQRDAAAAEQTESVPFFDESRVPIELIELPVPEIEGLEAGQFEIIGQKVTHRLAQRPGSYVILKYVRPLVKRRDTETIHCAPAPAGVLEGSRADVSFLVG